MNILVLDDEKEIADLKTDNDTTLKRVNTSINLIGETDHEAMIDLDKYLDDAYLAHIPNVTIIHGRGTGALRKAVHEKLRKSKYVKSYRLGTFGEGETGVTIVEFK